jgi:hypothetical protein
MALYSFKGARPTQLPNRLKFEDGFTKTDKTTFTAEDIAAAGWIEVEDPPVVNYPNKLEWDGENWVVREPNENETKFKWINIKAECTRRLAETDYKVIKSIETGQELDPVMVQYRQELRDLYNNVNNVDPWTVVYPFPQYPDEEANTAIETANTP